MWRSLIAVIVHCRYFCAHRGGHGSPLFVIAVAVVDGVDVVVVVVPSCAVFPFCWTGCFCYCFCFTSYCFCFTSIKVVCLISVFVDFGVVFLFVFRV